MVHEQLERRGISDARVLVAFAKVPRELFVPFPFRRHAYDDHPLPIGRGQTISQPYIVALMTQALALTRQARVLEVGTGSGYQTAILAELAASVRTIEWDRALAIRAWRRLRQLGYRNVEGIIGDGGEGWPGAGLFEGVIVTAATATVPDPLVAQLTAGGRLVIPLGDAQEQTLTLLVKRQHQIQRQPLCGCLFVPLRGQHGSSHQSWA